jgi:hypothetical protein
VPVVGFHVGLALQPAGGWTSATPINPAATLSASDGAVGDRIGYSVSTDQNGDTVAFGAPCDYTAGALRCGSVYVFLKGTGWPSAKTQDAKLTFQIAGSSSVVATLGISVSMDFAGDTIIAGASGVEALANGPGAVYVFLKPSSGTWTDSASANATLTASDGINNDLLGFSAIISGDGTTVVAGAVNNPTNTAANNASGPGAAYVFLRPLGGWNGPQNQAAKLTASNGQNNDFLGCFVSTSLDGGTVVVGAASHPVTNNTQGPGAVYVFAKPANGWTGSQSETQELTASAGTDIHGNSVTPTTGFGRSVSISSNGATIAAGGLATVGAASTQGAIYVF